MIRVVVVDDSPTVRLGCQRILSADPEIEVIATAPDPFVARDLIVKHAPDVLTLDLEMPRMDGLTFLRRLMHYRPMPVVVVSSLTVRGGQKALEMIRAGAISVVSKPGEGYSLQDMTEELLAAVKGAAGARVFRAPLLERVAKPPEMQAGPDPPVPRVIVLGASTGGPLAVEALLAALPPGMPPMLLTQHMPPVFTAAFAGRLNDVTGHAVHEAQDGEPLQRGTVLVAPGGKHLLLRRGVSRWVVQVKDGPPVNRHRPSVDVLFRSAAEVAGRQAVGILLTGMGTDGARGLLELRQAGALTLAQDEASSVVYGMPKAAVELGAATRVLDLRRIPGAVMAAVRALSTEKAPGAVDTVES